MAATRACTAALAASNCDCSDVGNGAVAAGLAVMGSAVTALALSMSSRSDSDWSEADVDGDASDEDAESDALLDSVLHFFFGRDWPWES